MLLVHCLLDKTYDRHHDATPNAAACDASHDTANIHPATAGGHAQKTEQLTANPTTNNASNGITERPQGQLLQQTACPIFANSTAR